jgi:hypothetical protein
MKDITIANDCGETILEVGCYMFEDGHAEITHAEREKTTPEKVADVAKDVGVALKKTFWQRTAVELGGSVDPFNTSDGWRAWAMLEPPVKLANIKVRGGVEIVSAEELTEVRPRVDVVIRFELGKRR